MARLGNRVLENHTLLLRHTSPVAPTLHVPPQGLSEEQGLYIYILLNPGIVTVGKVTEM